MGKSYCTWYLIGITCIACLNKARVAGRDRWFQLTDKPILFNVGLSLTNVSHGALWTSDIIIIVCAVVQVLLHLILSSHTTCEIQKVTCNLVVIFTIRRGRHIWTFKFIDI